MESSKIINFYCDKSILLTGSTGFLGKMVLEKLLRTCQDVKRIYVLVRPKKGKQTNERLDELFNGQFMKIMRQECPNYREKVVLIPGDLLLPNLGMSEKNISAIENEIDIIIHCAATVRFDAFLRNAVHINMRATIDLMGIARKMKKLEVFLYVSTAYSNCPRGRIEEQFYPSPMPPKKLLQFVDLLDDERLKAFTPTLLGEWPNTYTFTKAGAEALIAEEGHDLPMVVVRPSIILATKKEPFPGWIDNIYGPTSIVVACGLGFLKVVHCDKNCISDLVPVDYVVNLILATAYDTATQRKGHHINRSLNNETKIPIYNLCNYGVAPIMWGDLVSGLLKLGLSICPSNRCISYPTLMLTKDQKSYRIQFFLLQTIPAYILDMVLYMLGKKPIAVEMQKKIEEYDSILSYFSLNEWKFKSDNTKMLWERLSSVDQNNFYFSMENFKWLEYMTDYIKGIHVYIFKDTVESIPTAKRKLIIFYILHLFFVYSFRFFVIFIGYKFLTVLLTWISLNSSFFDSWLFSRYNE